MGFCVIQLSPIDAAYIVPSHNPTNQKLLLSVLDYIDLGNTDSVNIAKPWEMSSRYAKEGKSDSVNNPGMQALEFSLGIGQTGVESQVRARPKKGKMIGSTMHDNRSLYKSGLVSELK